MLDFKSLYSLLCSNYTIAVVEKAGYGFSENGEIDGNIDTVLPETRQALSLEGLSAPYVLCPHSMSGIEVLYWAQRYPQELSVRIGLDRLVPEAYQSVAVHEPLLRLAPLLRTLASHAGVQGLHGGMKSVMER